MTDSTDRTPAMLAALSVICFALASPVARMAPPTDAWVIQSMFWGLGIGLLVVAVRQRLKGGGGKR